MSERNDMIIELEAIFDKARTAERDEEGYFIDLDMHGAVGSALIGIGKEKINELRVEVYPYLNDPLPDFREDAVMTLGWHSRLMLPEFRDIAREIWLNDPNEDVRVVALIAWIGYYYFEPKDPKVLLELYEILTSGNFPIRARKHALIGLLDFSNINPDRTEQRDIALEMDLETHEEFNAIVDWNKVNRIMQTCVQSYYD